MDFRKLSLLLLISLGGCGGGQPVAAPNAPVVMDNDRAQKVFDQMKIQLAFHEDGTVDNMAAANDVLHRDELLRFPGAIAYLQGQDGAEAKALLAQLQLASAEAMQVTSQIMIETAERLETRLAQLAERDLTAEAKAEMGASLQDNIAKLKEMSDALALLSKEELTRGAATAKAVIAENPDNYLGYRVASDFYRMIGDWANFDLMVGKIRTINPDSNGLNFQLGASAWLREGDLEKANAYLQKALEKDPAFVRAQAYQVLIQKDPVARYQHYQALQALNGEHQIVLLAGYSITKAYDASKKE